MGQAFDDSGRQIDELFGATKREVFEKLNERNPDAAEIRVRTLRQQIDSQAGGQVEMPRYRSHKDVWALKIKDVISNDGGTMLVPEDSGYSAFAVSGDYIRKHQPTIGGYYVRYKDGYESFSPAQAFEEGYTLIPR